MVERYLTTNDFDEYVDVDCVREALGIMGDEDIFRAIEKLKEERDNLKEKCDKLKARANASYGVSCGYSGDKPPAFLCNVISYRWEPGCVCYSGTTLNDGGHISVELDLTPNANYEWVFDPEDLRQYIQNYGREKKLSDFEVFCKLVSNCIDELCDKYTVVEPDRNRTTRERLDYIFTVLGDYRGMHDSEWNRVEKLIKEKRAVEDSLAELRVKVREIYRSVVDDEWDDSLGYTSALNDINEEYKRVVHNFEERTADWSKAQQELDRYRLAVGSLLDIPKEARDDINAIERSFNVTNKKYKSLKEFRNDVCEILDIPSSMVDDQEQILKEIHDFADRYYELNDFRGDICGILDIESLTGTPQQNDKYILDRIENLNDDDTRLDRYARLRSNICTALRLGHEGCDGNIIGRIHMMQDCHDKLTVFRNDVAVAIGMTTKDSNSDILKRVRMTKDCHDKLCKDYTELKHGEELLIEFRDDVAKAIGITYPTTNNFIVRRVADIYKDRGEAHDLAMELDRKCIDLTAKNSDLKQKFEFQSGLRQQWHARYESEHERANGVQKALDREKEKCRVKDISLETAKKQYEKVCSNLETAECALNGMRSKVRSLQDEKTKVISALGQDIWDDAVK